VDALHIYRKIDNWVCFDIIHFLLEDGVDFKKNWSNPFI